MPRSSPHFSTGLSLHNTSYTNIPGRTVESAVGLLSPVLAPPTGQPRLGQPPFSNRSPQDARGANGIDRVRCSRGSACPAGAAKSACRCCRSAPIPANSGARLRLAPTNSGARSPGHESVALPRRGTPNPARTVLLVPSVLVLIRPPRSTPVWRAQAGDPVSVIDPRGLVMARRDRLSIAEDGRSSAEAHRWAALGVDRGLLGGFAWFSRRLARRPSVGPARAEKSPLEVCAPLRSDVPPGARVDASGRSR